MNEELEHFDACRQVIRENIRIYGEKVKSGKKETEDLYAALASGDVELYNQLIVSRDILTHMENMLRKNRAALKKPYFGRVDYTEEGTGTKESIYIGKNGVSKNKTEVLIVDWRAPVSAIYYENELGAGSYFVPDAGEIRVDLRLKRTFDISDGKLNGYYDNDTAATDELLVRYLSQNKDVVLGDIISTIQKEQNEIIRESPYCDVIVQGVAGSGKTTVAMHRISYILYNYEKKFVPSEFCIIGSNDMLLHYITSGLPELDVHDVRQKRMDLFFRELLELENQKELLKIFGKRPKEAAKKGEQEAVKSRMEFMLTLEDWLAAQKAAFVPAEDIRDEKLGVILSGESIVDTLKENPEYSVVQLQKLLNERIQKRIAFLMTGEESTEKKKAVKKRYRGYFQMEKGKSSIVGLYADFLQTRQCELPKPGEFSVYDLAALTLIWKRITAKSLVEEYGQVIIDEAQDFGESVYYVLKQVLFGCHYTIMGDVSQNINYDTGMNDWEELRKQVFCGERQHFHILAKSYRNTIEISEYAGRILKRASLGAYRITPVIRHGREVEFYRTGPGEAALSDKVRAVLNEVQARGYDTAAVICRGEAQAARVRRLLGIEESAGGGDAAFSKGVMVLSIQLTKGLEFDAVILYNPSPADYGENEAEAKLLYVAVTRALHELHVVYEKELSALFEE